MIEAWSEGRADENMPEAILVELASVTERHPWWRARARLTIDLLDRLGVRPPARVLDAGCGWGVTLEALDRLGYRATGLDVSQRALERIDRPDRRLVLADLSRPLPTGAEAEAFDAVLALDVIEHLDDDRAAVSRLGALARPGGLVLVSVPALPELFGEFDAIQGHRRRYRPETLTRAFEGSGLLLDRLLWWGLWMVPILRRRRSVALAVPGEPPSTTYLRHLRLPPWPIPTGLRLAFALEHGLALRGLLRSGTSLIAVARRPNDDGHRTPERT